MPLLPLQFEFDFVFAIAFLNAGALITSLNLCREYLLDFYATISINVILIASMIVSTNMSTWLFTHRITLFGGFEQWLYQSEISGFTTGLVVWLAIIKLWTSMMKDNIGVPADSPANWDYEPTKPLVKQPAPTAAGAASRGFTLIELLVVIAIISILAAIIVPAFSTAQEHAREANSMSHLHDIGASLELYKLDNKYYPPVLFAYAYPGTSMVTEAAKLAADQKAGVIDPTTNAVVDPARYQCGLYPEYVKSLATFTDDNNKASYNDVDPQTVNVLQLQMDGTLAAGTKQIYAADAYDANPEITGPNTIDKTKYIIRYMTSWTNIQSNLETQTSTGEQPITPETPRDDYKRQLMWSNPPSAYVACSTWHVPNVGQVIVLFGDGAARKMDVGNFLATGPQHPVQYAGGMTMTFPVQEPDSDVVPLTTGTANAANYPPPGVSHATFWKASER